MSEIRTKNLLLVCQASKEQLKDMVIKLIRDLELIAFDGGRQRCKYCGAGILYLENNGWRPERHQGTCILAEALELVAPEYRRIEAPRRYDRQGCPAGLE